MDLCKQWFAYGKINEAPPENYNPDNINQPYYDPEVKYGAAIPGGVAKGYNPKELIDFFDSLEGYSSYLFNKSHAATYSVLTLATAYLKKYHPAEFISAVLSIQAANNEDRDKYVKVAREMGLHVQCPDINESGRFFTPKAEESTILYGIESIKGLGAAKVDAILEGRPYKDFKDCLDRLPKNIFNKTVATNLIKAGAFDQECNNRHEMINYFHGLRNIKEEPLDPDLFDEQAHIDMETEIIGAPVTYQPWWDLMGPNKKFTEEMEITYVNERKDKRGRLMAFGNAKCNHCEIEFIAFASKYGKIHHLLNPAEGQKVLITGKKDEKGMLLIDSARKNKNMFDGL